MAIDDSALPPAATPAHRPALRCHRLEINEVDRAVLSLKSQVRKLEQQRTRVSTGQPMVQGNCHRKQPTTTCLHVCCWPQIQAAIDREQQLARELVAAGRKDRALLALKKRKLQETQAASLDGLLLNVEQMVRPVPLRRCFVVICVYGH